MQYQGASEGSALRRPYRKCPREHLGNGIGDAPPLHDDIRNENTEDTDDKNIRDHRRCLSDHVCIHERDAEDKDTHDHGAENIRNPGQFMKCGAACRKCDGRGQKDQHEIDSLVKIGKDKLRSAVEQITELTIVCRLVVVGKAQGIPLKKRLEQLRDRGCDQTPDAEIDKILVELCAGCEPPAELAGEPHKPYSKCYLLHSSVFVHS